MKNKIFTFILLGVLTILHPGCQDGAVAPSKTEAQDSIVYEAKQDTDICSSPNDTFRIDSVVYNIEHYHYRIPHALPCDSAIAGNINKEILSVLMIDEFKLTNSDWLHGANFKHDTASGILHIDLESVFMGAHGEYWHQWDLFFNLVDGKRVDCRKFPFSALFTINGYLEFLHSRNWFDQLYKSLSASYNEYYEGDTSEHVEQEIAQTYLAEIWNIDYKIEDGKVSFWRQGTIFGDTSPYEPWDGGDCSLSELEPYLSDVGKEVVKLVHAELIPRVLREKQLWEQLPDYAFFETKGVQIGVDATDPNHIKGFAFSGKEYESVSGFIAEGNFELTGAKSGKQYTFPKKGAVTKLSEWNDVLHEMHKERNTLFME